MIFTYLLLNLFTISVPLARSFEPRIAYYKTFKSLFFAIAVTGVVFITWDLFFTKTGVWSFNYDYLIGVSILGLPLEEWLFFVTVPFACVFIHEVLKYFFPDYFKKIAVPLAYVAGAGLLVLGLLNLDLLYTGITFSATGLFLIALAVLKPWFLGRFWLTYCVHLLPFFVINGILTSLPVVKYNNSENLGIRLGTIPVEDAVYSMLLLLMVISLYEYFNQRFAAKA